MPEDLSGLWRGPDRWLHSGQPPHTIVVGPNGQRWQVTVWWAEVDGQAVPAGIDVRSFYLVGGDPNKPGPVLPSRDLGPVNAALFRSLRVAEIVEQTRMQLVYENLLTAGEIPKHRRYGVDHLARAQAKQAAEIAATEQKRPGRPSDRDDDFVRLVADLYLEAKRRGGRDERQPWHFVKTGLRERGHGRVSDGQLRNWYRRAVKLGYITSKGRGE